MGKLKMFPRKISIARLASVGGCAFFLCWLWMTTSTSHSLVDIVLQGENTPLLTRINTVTNLTQELSHRHSNDTLKQLASNMTVLKANQSDLGEIIAAVNKSKGEVIEMDQTKYKNPHPFKYLLNAPNICKNKEVFLIAYVHTAPDHYKRRMVIRETWGSPKAYTDTIIRVVFVMGKSFEKPEIQAALAFESETYGDVIQEDFLDSYKNLTYKGIAALKWVSQNCRHAKFVLKTDDDIFVNTFTLLRHLQSMERQSTNNTGLIMCLVWNRMKVMRTGKWAVSKDDFKDDFYPTYCSGSAFVLSTDVAVVLHDMSYHVPFFWVDDFYITGLLPLKAGIKHKQFMSTYVLDGRQLEKKFTGPQWYSYVFSHIHDLNKIQAVWWKIVSLAKGDEPLNIKFAQPGELAALAKAADEAEAAKKAAAAAKKKKKP